ncbi:hypothetical protein BCR32DRAFT_278844 [Anaeromyces robustus]|uniref:Chitin-binding type-1 domain-containing protein n=1 Tax=Anaeromyces robustus TaxID=1754192 RepID=A0A1Y1X9P6_9FUNG|nr:hypothetical protein BCR32DRAFT_278844 [Anaeromyces robustus]|eukprot:ORX82458.1 hypothetical protein BCR32DRAFT_278844 [Anaeromyces robustus]
MKSFKLLLPVIAFLSFTSVVKSYEIECTQYYEVKENEDYINTAGKNRYPLSLLTYLNPDVDFSNVVADGKCGKGKGTCPYYECCSKDGTCGKKRYHCGEGCDPYFGMCDNGTWYEDVKEKK